jgi:hypothetical protein
MLGLALDRLGGLFDPKFLVAYWSPVFLGTALAAAFYALANASLGDVSLLGQLDVVEQLLLGGAVIVGITVVAYLLSMVTAPIVRVYEGIWPSLLNALAVAKVADARKAHRRLREDMAALHGRELKIPRENGALFLKKYAQFSMRYPRDTLVVMPTRLGNTLVAAEEYPRLRYNMDAVFWWPRLYAVMPAEQQSLVAASVTPMIALLNLATVVFLVALGATVWLFAHPGWGWPWWGYVGLAPMIVAYLIYRIAVVQASSYTMVIRTMFDLHRFALLQQMHIPLPSPEVERQTWGDLLQWLYYGDPRVLPEGYAHAIAGSAYEEPKA